MEDELKFIEEKALIEKRALILINEYVNNIIKNKCEDISIIEQTLDILLGFTFVDSSLVFNKLNDYYSSINREYSLEYKLIYKELKEID